MAVGGLGLLMGLAVLIGRRLDQDARHEAWLRIAAARRINAEQQRRNEQQALLLDVREDDLDLRERRLDLRETRFLEREELMAEYERKLDEGR
ncbi:hypothetical protein [Pseudonocardia lacus]|uniref:hypothetical protein n=1 Tax=Pseudonocardia lacus TaxID=2835865 RepID=UPI001BDCDA6C|nr:hypothetical protein [Pseudonocardia lacus]